MRWGPRGASPWHLSSLSLGKGQRWRPGQGCAAGREAACEAGAEHSGARRTPLGLRHRREGGRAGRRSPADRVIGGGGGEGAARGHPPPLTPPPRLSPQRGRPAPRAPDVDEAAAAAAARESLSAEPTCRRRGAARGGRAGRAAGRSASASGCRTPEPPPCTPGRPAPRSACGWAASASRWCRRVRGSGRGARGAGGHPRVPCLLPGDPVSGPLTAPLAPRPSPFPACLTPRPDLQLSNPFPPPLLWDPRSWDSPAPSSHCPDPRPFLRSPSSFLWPREQLRTPVPPPWASFLDPKPCRPTLQVERDGVPLCEGDGGWHPRSRGQVGWTPSLESGLPPGAWPPPHPAPPDALSSSLLAAATLLISPPTHLSLAAQCCLPASVLCLSLIPHLSVLRFCVCCPCLRPSVSL